MNLWKNTLKYLKRIKEHYAIITALGAFIFSLICTTYSKSYLSEFDINFFLFFGFTDIYRIPSANTATSMITGFALIITGIIIFQFVSKDMNKDDSIKKKNKIIIKIISIVLPIFMMIIIFNEYAKHPEKRANYIKEGFNTRYNVYVKDINKKYNCASIILSTPQYMFIWDYDKNKAKIIPTSMIKEIDLAIKFDIFDDEYYRTHRFTYMSKDKITEWNEKIKEKCI